MTHHPHDPGTAPRVRREYERLAEAYDRRWAAYVERSLAIVRPWLEGAALGRVLDLGCGTGALVPRLGRWKAEVSAYVGLDPSAAMLRLARANEGDASWPVAFAAGAAEALPFADLRFDTVVSASSLHYWDGAGRGLAEARRVLRRGGRLVLLDWRRDAWTMRAMDIGMRLARVPYERMYSRAEVRALLRGAGFRVAREATGRAGAVWALAAWEALAE
jgi:SAM-dependent methyltransferase